MSCVDEEYETSVRIAAGAALYVRGGGPSPQICVLIIWWRLFTSQGGAKLQLHIHTREHGHCRDQDPMHAYR